MSWVLLHEDDFSGGTAEINGSTMSDGVGTWTVRGGNGIVARSSGEAVSNAGSWTDVPYYDAVMSGTQEDQASEVEYVDTGSGGGAMTRWNGSEFYYMSRGGATTTLYYGAGLFPGTSIGAWAHTAAAGEVGRLESVGSDHEVFFDGVSLGSASDATVASGRSGIWQAFGHRCDNFKDFVPGTPPVTGGRSNLLLLGVG